MFGITSGKRALFFFEKNNILLNDFPHFAGNPIGARYISVFYTKTYDTGFGARYGSVIYT